MSRIPKEQTHQYKFDILQDEWLRTGSKRVLGEMYLVVLDIERNYVKKYLRSKGLKWEPDDVEEMAHDAATWVIELLLKDPTKKLGKVTVYAEFGKRKALFKFADQEMRELPFPEDSDDWFDQERGFE